MLIAALAWMLATLTVAGSALALARRLDRNPGSFVVVHTVVINWAWFVTVATALSIGHWLTGPALIGGVSVVALATAIGLVRRDGQVSNSRLPDAGSLPDGWPVAIWPPCSACGAVMSYREVVSYLIHIITIMYHYQLIDYWIQAQSLVVSVCGCARL